MRVRIVDANDPATIGGDATGAVTEDATETEASGTLTVSDPDAGQNTFRTQTETAGTYGTFTLECERRRGPTRWTDADPDTDALVAGETVHRHVHGGERGRDDVAQVVITVTGSDDAAVIGGAMPRVR